MVSWKTLFVKVSSKDVAFSLDFTDFSGLFTTGAEEKVILVINLFVFSRGLESGTPKHLGLESGTFETDGLIFAKESKGHWKNCRFMYCGQTIYFLIFD